MKDALVWGLITGFSELNVFFSHQLIPRKSTERLTVGVSTCSDQLTHPLARGKSQSTCTVNVLCKLCSALVLGKLPGKSVEVSVMYCCACHQRLIHFMENLNRLVRG